MIRLLYTEISTLPEAEKIADELPDSFLRAYLEKHPKPTSAGLGGLWLAAYAGAEGRLTYDSAGRPNLLDANYRDLSISHTRELVFCALASGEHQRIGLDAEDGGRLDEATMEKIAGRFFAEAERMELENAQNRKAAFLAIWTKKEAYAKYHGEGLAALLAGKIPQESCYFTSEKVGGHRVTLCADQPFAGGFPAPEKVEFFVKHG